MTARDPELFIPEKYVNHKEILVQIDGYGYGIRIPAKDLGKAILDKRIAAQIIANRDFVAIIHETAMPPTDT
jgi:hypothetical protein